MSKRLIKDTVLVMVLVMICAVAIKWNKKLSTRDCLCHKMSANETSLRITIYDCGSAEDINIYIGEPNEQGQQASSSPDK